MGENGKYTVLEMEKRMCRLRLILFYEIMTRSKKLGPLGASCLSIFEIFAAAVSVYCCRKDLVICLVIEYVPL